MEHQIQTPSSSRPTWTKEPDKVLLWEPRLSGMKCDVIEIFDDSVVELERRLAHTMVCYEGIGLAAPQVGIWKRAFVMDYQGTYRFMANPKITGYSGWTHEKEGCLSAPGCSSTGNRLPNPAFVRRYAEIEVEYRNRTGEVKREEFKGYTARVVLHETDHLLGKFFIDHCSTMQRGAVLDKLSNFKRYYAREISE